ncbi:MAG: glycosyltransferase family 39 protein [Candidatus Liptonbacteria bacterium]
MTKRNAFWGLLVILIIATFLRTYQLNKFPPGLYPDEAMNGNNALEAIKTGEYKVYYPENNGREGLFINIQALFLRVIGVNEPWVLRLVSALVGILTVAGIYFLAKELFSRKVGLLAAFFLATSFWHINFSRIGFRAISACMFAVWGFYLLWLGIRKTDAGYGGIWRALLGGIIFGLGFHTYIAYRVLPLLLIVPIIYFRKNKGFWRVLGVFLLGAFLSGLPIGLYYLQNPGDFFGRTSQISVFSSDSMLKDLSLNIGDTLWMFFYNGDYNWRHNYAGRAQLFWPVALMFLGGITMGILTILKKYSPSCEPGANEDGEITARKTRASFWLIFLWFGLAMLPVIISNEGLPHALRALLLIPPAMILAAVAGIWLYDKAQELVPTKTLRGFATIFLALLFLEAYQTYFLLWGPNQNTQGAFSANYLDIGHQINNSPKDRDKYVIVEAGGVDVRGYPMSTQTTMFITDTFLPADREAKKVHYVRPDQMDQIPPDALRFYLR